MDESDLHRRDWYKNTCWVAFLHPFTFVVPDDEKPWKVKLEDINNVSYSSGNLTRIVSRFKINEIDLDGVICYDGAIAIPRKGKLSQKEDAVNFFNKLFTQLLFCDFKVEGVDLRDIVTGKLYDNYAITTYDFGNSANSHLHTKIRHNYVNNIDSIYLDSPRIIKVGKLLKIINDGEEIIKKIPNLSPKFLMKGITEIRYKNWDLVLSNLWITAEQIIDFLWHNVFLKTQKFHPNKNIDGRITSLKDDTRTWSTAIKQEILFQNKIITDEIFNELFNARKIRNKLVHEGKSVDRTVAVGLFSAVTELLKIATLNKTILSKFEIDEKFFSDERKILDNSFFEEWRNLPENNFTEARFGPEILKKVKIKPKRK